MKYLCYYDYNQGGHPSRSNPPASATKIRYIANCLAEIEPTEIISASGVLGTNSDSARVDYITKQLLIRYFFSMGRKNKILGKLGTALVQMQLLLYLLFNVSKNETIIVYHSLAYMNLVQIAKKIKGFRLILEVEEIYADVIGNTKIRQKEIAAIKKANAYIFPTQLLNAKLNEEGKPAIIIHGTYQVESKMTSIDTDKTKVDERRIVHCVYAGTFDPRKGGAAAAAAAAAFLPSNYHMHILGFGTEAEKKAMQDTINTIAEKSKAKVTYDGLLTGEDYIRFIQGCDIGLSTQNPDAAFNATSFPSKILSYMANGLRVVSVRIPAIEQSEVGKMLYYYDKQTPEEIAQAIVSVNMKDKYNSRKTIQNLDEKFKVDLRELLEA